MEDSVAEELSVHHDFNQSTTAKIFEMVQEIQQYLQKVCTPILHQGAMKNVLTGEIVTKVNVDKLYCCMKVAVLIMTMSRIDSDYEKALFTQPSAESSSQPARKYLPWQRKLMLKMKQSRL